MLVKRTDNSRYKNEYYYCDMIPSRGQASINHFSYILRRKGRTKSESSYVVPINCIEIIGEDDDENERAWDLERQMIALKQKEDIVNRIESSDLTIIFFDKETEDIDYVPVGFFGYTSDVHYPSVQTYYDFSMSVFALEYLKSQPSRNSFFIYNTRGSKAAPTRWEAHINGENFRGIMSNGEYIPVIRNLLAKSE